MGAPGLYILILLIDIARAVVADVLINPKGVVWIFRMMMLVSLLHSNRLDTYTFFRPSELELYLLKLSRNYC